MTVLEYKLLRQFCVSVSTMQCYKDDINYTANDFFRDPIPLFWMVGIEAVPAVLIFLLFIYLSIRLRKRAWNSPTKRFTRSFEISFILLFLIIGIFSLPSVINDVYNNNILDLFYFYFHTLPVVFISCPVFFMSFAATALLFQVVFPWLPGRIKRFLESDKVKMARICLEILVPLSVIIYVCLNIAFVYTNLEEEGDFLVVSAVLFASTGTIFFISLFLSTFSFVCLISFLCILARSNVKSNTLLKLLPFFGLILISCLFSLALIVFFIVCSESWEGLVSVLYAVFCTIFVIAINTLIFPRDVIWCCFKCCRRRPANPNVRTPLLINTAEGQETIPISVWDHRNDPSTTATNYPPEMTDCRSDYEQIL